MPWSRRLRRFVDWDLSDGPRPGAFSLLVGFALLAGPLTLIDVEWLRWSVAAPVALSWFAFVAWRASRMARAAAIRGDRGYDRVTRAMLSSEYRETESATITARRKARRK